VRVSPLVSGTVVETAADATDLVREGEVLLRLDTADARLALDSAWENLYAQTLNVRSLVSEKARLAANLRSAETALALARSDYERRLKLSPGTSVTKEELERYRLQAELAEAALAAAAAASDSNSSLLGPGPPSEHPSIRLAAASVERAWLALERCEIRSPVTGTVARRAAQLGAQASPQQPVLIIVEEGRVWVDANFKESQLARIRPGMPAKVTADMLGGKVVYPGVVEGVGAGTGSVFSLLPPENATGNWIKVVQRVPVRITLDERALAENPLLLGLSCRVEVDLVGGSGPSPPRRGRREELTAAYDYAGGPVRERISYEVSRRLDRPEETWKVRAPDGTDAGRKGGAAAPIADVTGTPSPLAGGGTPGPLAGGGVPGGADGGS
jgi:membrane fusion protein (multidrug efflux system)